MGRKKRWEGNGVLMLQRPGEAYAIWVFWFGEERAFRGWYVNLQEPFRRNGSGYDTQDLELDIVVPVDGPWEWKDDELLDVRVAEGRFTPEQAAAARDEGRRVGALLDAGERWWDDSWASWRPPAGCRTPSMARATMSRRFPTLLAFVTLGLFWGAWASVLPDVQRATGVSKGALGIALLCVSLGSIPSMLFIAGPARRPLRQPRGGGLRRDLRRGDDAAGSRRVAAAARARAARRRRRSGALDVGINANAGRLETESGKRLMPMAHGLYSVGILVGAVGAGLARNAGAQREQILLGVAVAHRADRGARRLRATSTRRPSEGKHTIRIERALLGLGILCAVAFVVEGGIESWSALFLERELDAPPAVSGLGPGVFGASMAVGRFYGQGTEARRATLLVGSGLLAARRLLHRRGRAERAGGARRARARRRGRRAVRADRLRRRRQARCERPSRR